MTHSHVALHAHGVDAQAAAAQLADELHHGVALAREPHVVVVVVELGFGVGLVGVLERERDELLAQNLVKGRAAVAAVLHYGLVHYVPCGHVASAGFHHAVNPALEFAVENLVLFLWGEGDGRCGRLYFEDDVVDVQRGCAGCAGQVERDGLAASVLGLLGVEGAAPFIFLPFGLGIERADESIMVVGAWSAVGLGFDVALVGAVIAELDVHFRAFLKFGVGGDEHLRIPCLRGVGCYFCHVHLAGTGAGGVVDHFGGGILAAGCACEDVLGFTLFGVAVLDEGLHDGSSGCFEV